MIVFVIIFIIIGSLFLTNLFTGIIFSKYIESERKMKNKFLTDDQNRWIGMQRQIVSERPDLAFTRPPTSKFRRFLFDIQKSFIFETAILVCIILNILTYAMVYETNPIAYVQVDYQFSY